MEASELNDHLLPLCSHEDDDKLAAETLGLLEKCWFFDNLLMGRRTKITLRCNADPCSTVSQELVDKCKTESTPSIVHVGGGTDDEVVADPGLDDIFLSLPVICEGKLMPDKPFRNGLHSMPSLPPSIGREKFTAGGDGECHHGNGSSKLTRQSSLMNPPTNSLPPRITYKGNARASCNNIKPCHPQRISRAKSMNVDRRNQTRHHQYLNRVKAMRKSLSDLETEEVQGFKDLGFRFEKGDLTPNVVDILPGLQENKTFDDVAAGIVNVRRPYLSEVWAALPVTSPHSFSDWDAKKSPKDMKADIKFWARAVASGVR